MKLLKGYKQIDFFDINLDGLDTWRRYLRIVVYACLEDVFFSIDNEDEFEFDQLGERAAAFVKAFLEIERRERSASILADMEADAELEYEHADD